MRDNHRKCYAVSIYIFKCLKQRDVTGTESLTAIVISGLALQCSFAPIASFKCNFTKLPFTKFGHGGNTSQGKRNNNCFAIGLNGTRKTFIDTVINIRSCKILQCTQEYLT